MQEPINGGLTEKQRVWLEHLRTWEQSGKSLKVYADENDLDVRLAYHYKVALSRKGLLSTAGRSQPRFVRARLPRLEAGAMGNCRVYLPNGAIVEFACSPDLKALRLVLEAASTLS